MGNYEQLKQSVSDVIKTNGNQEITGSILQNVLLTIISSVGANATFAGVATPTTNPGTPDGPVFYLASESGIYTNFGSVELQDGLSVLSWNGSWSSKQVFGIDDEPTVGSDNLVKSGGVYAKIKAIEDAGYVFAGIATPTTNPGTPDGPVFWIASESGTYSNFGSIELQAGLSVLMWNGSWSSQQIFGIDDVPTAGSDNLVKSDGVKKGLDDIEKRLVYYYNLMSDATINAYIKSNGWEIVSDENWRTTDFIPVIEGYPIYYTLFGHSNLSNITFYTTNQMSSGSVIETYVSVQTNKPNIGIAIAPPNSKYVRICGSSDDLMPSAGMTFQAANVQKTTWDLLRELTEDVQSLKYLTIHNDLSTYNDNSYWSSGGVISNYNELRCTSITLNNGIYNNQIIFDTSEQIGISYCWIKLQDDSYSELSNYAQRIYASSPEEKFLITLPLGAKSLDITWHNSYSSYIEYEELTDYSTIIQQLLVFKNEEELKQSYTYRSIVYGYPFVYTNEEADGFGDSIMQGYIDSETIDQAHSWFNVLIGKLGLKKGYNNGFGGHCLTNIVSQTNNVLYVFTHSSPASKYLFFNFGTNDYYQQAPLGSYTSNNAGEFYGALNLLFDDIRTRFSDRICIFNLPINSAYTPTNKAITIKDYRQAIFMKCVENGAVVIDSASLPFPQDDMTNPLKSVLFGSDGIHPSVQGYEMIASNMADLLL